MPKSRGQGGDTKIARRSALWGGLIFAQSSAPLQGRAHQHCFWEDSIYQILPKIQQICAELHTSRRAGCLEISERNIFTPKISVAMYFFDRTLTRSSSTLRSHSWPDSRGIFWPTKRETLSKHTEFSSHRNRRLAGKSPRTPGWMPSLVGRGQEEAFWRIRTSPSPSNGLIYELCDDQVTSSLCTKCVHYLSYNWGCYYYLVFWNAPQTTT